MVGTSNLGSWNGHWFVSVSSQNSDQPVPGSRKRRHKEQLKEAEQAQLWPIWVEFGWKSDKTVQYRQDCNNILYNKWHTSVIIHVWSDIEIYIYIHMNRYRRQIHQLMISKCLWMFFKGMVLNWDILTSQHCVFLDLMNWNGSTPTLLRFWMGYIPRGFHGASDS